MAVVAVADEGVDQTRCLSRLKIAVRQDVAGDKEKCETYNYYLHCSAETCCCCFVLGGPAVTGQVG